MHERCQPLATKKWEGKGQQKWEEECEGQRKCESDLRISNEGKVKWFWCEGTPAMERSM